MSFSVARLRHARISAQKVRRFSSSLSHLPALSAAEMLEKMPQRAARLLRKLVLSAVGNAESGWGGNAGDLRIASVVADEAATIRRIKMRARGRADRILRRGCHITVTLYEIFRTT